MPSFFPALLYLRCPTLFSSLGLLLPSSCQSYNKSYNHTITNLCANHTTNMHKILTLAASKSAKIAMDLEIGTNVNDNRTKLLGNVGNHSLHIAPSLCSTDPRKICNRARPSNRPNYHTILFQSPAEGVEGIVSDDPPNWAKIFFRANTFLWSLDTSGIDPASFPTLWM